VALHLNVKLIGDKLMSGIKRYIETQKEKGNLVQGESGELKPTLTYLMSDRKEPLIEGIIQKKGNNYNYNRHGRFWRDQSGK